MAKDKVVRKLAAIFAADMVGYSRLMEADEEGTISRQMTHRKELIDPKIAEFHGHIVKLMGDGMLVEFASVVDALRCAVDVQKAMAIRERRVPNDRRIAYRIGINLGDIILDGEDILGDGVNLASRLENLAAPGGICISDVVHQSVAGKIRQKFHDLGVQKFKNIKRPIRAYGVVIDGIHNIQQRYAELETDPRSPEKPSIAVLPFQNMSGDVDQEYLADGLTEDIITALSKVAEMSVIARNSTFAYKGTSSDIREIAKKLAVTHILEGSVRRSANRIRITAQLIDASDGHHLWAERYDRQFGDIFDLQDEITSEVSTALQSHLTEGDQAHVRRRQTRNVDAWEHFAQGQTCLRRFNKQDNARARELVHRAVEIDREFAAAWCLLSWIYYLDARNGWAESIEDTFDRAIEFAQRSIAIDPELPDAFGMLGAIYFQQRKYDEAVVAGRKAIALGPRVADNYALLAMTLCYAGNAPESLGLIEQAMRLSPYYPDWYLGIAGVIYRNLGRFDDAIAADKERLDRNPDNTFSDFRLAAVYEQIGRHDEARSHIVKAIKKNPEWTIRQIRVAEPYRDKDELETYLDLLRKAGLPE